MISKLKVMKIFSLVLALCVSFALMPVSAEAQLPFSLRTVKDANSVIVECTLSPARGEVDVTFLLLKPGFNYRDIDASVDGAAFEATVDMDVVKTGNDGKARYSYLMPTDAETGTYTVVASVYGVYAPQSEEIFFASPEVRARALSDANAADSDEEMANIVEDYKAEFLIGDMYQVYSDSEYGVSKKYVNDALVAARPFAEIADFTKVFNEKVAISAVNGAKETKVFAAIARVHEYLAVNGNTLDLSVYNSYADKVIPNKIMYNMSFATIGEIFDGYSVMEALMAVNASAWGELGSHRVDGVDKAGALVEYNESLGLNLNGKFGGLRDKSSVYKAIANSSKKPYIKLADLQSEFDRAVTAAYNAENAPAPDTTGRQDKGKEVIYTNPSDTIVVPPAQDSFPDLGSVDWAVESINALYEKGIVAGDGGLFRPNDNVTREQFVKMLVVAFGFTDESADTSLSDVDKGAWYHLYVASAEKAGITTGMEDGSFGVGANITRQQMAAMAYRAALKAGKAMSAGSLPQFTDSESIDSYAVESISAMQEAGIINGMGDGSFAPNATATRAQAAKIIYALINL